MDTLPMEQLDHRRYGYNHTSLGKSASPQLHAQRPLLTFGAHAFEGRAGVGALAPAVRGMSEVTF